MKQGTNKTWTSADRLPPRNECLIVLYKLDGEIIEGPGECHNGEYYDADSGEKIEPTGTMVAWRVVQ